MSAEPSVVDIREVGPRDGLQIERPISTEAKIELLDALVATGVKRIEATAFVSPRAVPAMADAEQVARYVADRTEVRWSALVVNAKGAERAIGAGLTGLEYVVSAGEGHSQANAKRSTAQAVADIKAVADIVRAAGGTCEVIIATAWDCPFDGPTPIQRTVDIARQAQELGADQLCLADTIGTATPGRVLALVEAVRAAQISLPLGAHFHNTRGSGLACAWAAVSAGVTMLDASTAGLGGCPFAPGASGNIATEELVYLLEDSGITTGISLPRALAAAALAERLVGHPASSNLLRAGGPSRACGAAAETDIAGIRSVSDMSAAAG
jgi:hydroxymethylglutaryl-CoA lyase